MIVTVRVRHIKNNILIYIRMDKVIITQQNKPINYVVKIKRDIKNNVNKNVVNIFPIYKLSLIYF